MAFWCTFVSRHAMYTVMLRMICPARLDALMYVSSFIWIVVVRLFMVFALITSVCLAVVLPAMASMPRCSLLTSSLTASCMAVFTLSAMSCALRYVRLSPTVLTAFSFCSMTMSWGATPGGQSPGGGGRMLSPSMSCSLSWCVCTVVALLMSVSCITFVTRSWMKSRACSVVWTPPITCVVASSWLRCLLLLAEEGLWATAWTNRRSSRAHGRLPSTSGPL